MLLNQCTGIDIWPLDVCRAQGVPEEWVDELSDCFESGFDHDEETIYHQQNIVNQFHGVHDLQLARRIAAHLGVDVEQASTLAWSPAAEVRSLKEAADEL